VEEGVGVRLRGRKVFGRRKPEQEDQQPSGRYKVVRVAPADDKFVAPHPNVFPGEVERALNAGDTAGWKLVNIIQVGTMSVLVVWDTRPGSPRRSGGL
jgi:hypothetical protein